MSRLDGKVALITGTAGGQGRAAATLFAAEGATVVGTDVNAEGAAETVELVRAAGGRMDRTHPARPRRRGRRRRDDRAARRRWRRARHKGQLHPPPGKIGAPATEGDLLAPDHPMRTIARAVPLGRIGAPEEVAMCALFLASDESSYVTATNLVVDGGWSAVLPGAC